MKRLVSLLAAAALALTLPTIASAHPDGKVFVCKYVGTPGDDERLQTGDNPISVSVNAIPIFDKDTMTPDDLVGESFADKQGRSLVIAVDAGQEEPECPAGGGVSPTPTPTPTASPTSTPQPTATPAPTVTPTSTPTAAPSDTPTPSPTATITPSRTDSPIPPMPRSDTAASVVSGPSTGWVLAIVLGLFAGVMVILAKRS